MKEGDFLWQLLEYGDEVLDSKKIKDIIKQGWNLAATDAEAEETIINRAMMQNFIPVVDDRKCYIGMITRRDIIQSILNKKVDSRYIVLPKEVEAFH